MFVHTGDYVRHINDDVLHSTYYTFTPCPLLEGDFYTMDDALAALLAEVHRTLGILEGITLSLSDNGCFAHLMLLRESCLSKMIDYPDFNIHSVLEDRGLGKADDGISNIMAAYQYAMNADAQKLNINQLTDYVLFGSETKQETHTVSVKQPAPYLGGWLFSLWIEIQINKYPVAWMFQRIRPARQRWPERTHHRPSTHRPHKRGQLSWRIWRQV